MDLVPAARDYGGRLSEASGSYRLPESILLDALPTPQAKTAAPSAAKIMAKSARIDASWGESRFA